MSSPSARNSATFPLAFLAGTHLTTLYEEISRYQLYLLIALGVLAAVLFGRRLLQRRDRN